MITEDNRDMLSKEFDSIIADCDSKGLGYDACMNIRGDYLHISDYLSSILYNIEVIKNLDDVYIYGITDEKICKKVFELISKYSTLNLSS